MMLRQLIRRLRSGVRSLTGSDEDRASLWSGISALRSEMGAIRRENGELATALDMTRLLLGRNLEIQAMSGWEPASIQDAEFKVFSQFGDDGIIQYLVRRFKIEPHVFIEFGVEDYRESNTRFLLMNNNWRGLVMDGSASNVARIRQDDVCVFHDLTPLHAFVTRENINGLFAQNGFSGRIGILSIDIDGNDYWIWEAIKEVDPVMVICEYNSVFGPDRALTVPYDPGFERKKAHFSNLYYGVSLKALCILANRKGYAFVGSNSRGNNAYFVKRDRLGDQPELTAAEGWRESRFRESRGPGGELTFVSGGDRLKLISGCPVYDVETGIVGSL